MPRLIARARSNHGTSARRRERGDGRWRHRVRDGQRRRRHSPDKPRAAVSALDVVTPAPHPLHYVCAAVGSQVGERAGPVVNAVDEHVIAKPFATQGDVVVAGAVKYDHPEETRDALVLAQGPCGDLAARKRPTGLLHGTALVLQTQGTEETAYSVCRHKARAVCQVSKIA